MLTVSAGNTPIDSEQLAIWSFIDETTKERVDSIDALSLQWKEAKEIPDFLLFIICRYVFAFLLLFLFWLCHLPRWLGRRRRSQPTTALLVGWLAGWLLPFCWYFSVIYWCVLSRLVDRYDTVVRRDDCLPYFSLISILPYLLDGKISLVSVVYTLLPVSSRNKRGVCNSWLTDVTQRRQHFSLIVVVVVCQSGRSIDVDETNHRNMNNLLDQLGILLNDNVELKSPSRHGTLTFHWLSFDRNFLYSSSPSIPQH